MFAVQCHSISPLTACSLSVKPGQAADRDRRLGWGWKAEKRREAEGGGKKKSLNGKTGVKIKEIEGKEGKEKKHCEEEKEKLGAKGTITGKDMSKTAGQEEDRGDQMSFWVH